MSRPGHVQNSPSQPRKIDVPWDPPSGGGPFHCSSPRLPDGEHRRVLFACRHTRCPDLSRATPDSITAALSHLAAFSLTPWTGAFTGNCFYLKFEEPTLVAIFILAFSKLLTILCPQNGAEPLLGGQTVPGGRASAGRAADPSCRCLSGE